MDVAIGAVLGFCVGVLATFLYMADDYEDEE